MEKIYEKTDLYLDLYGASIDTLNESKSIGLTPRQSILRFLEDYEAIFQDNEFEKILMLIPIGIFAVENNCLENNILCEVKYAITQIESNNYDNLLHDGEKDEILKNIKSIKEYLNK